MEKSTKIFLGASTGVLTCVGLAVYFRKKKMDAAATGCNVAGGCVAVVAAGALGCSLRKKYERELEYRKSFQPRISEINYMLSEIHSREYRPLGGIGGKTTRKRNEDTLREWLYDAVSFIKNNAEDKYELLLADKLCRMMDKGKIQLDDVRNRHENLDAVNADDDRNAFFDPYRNTVTGEQRNIIVLDINKMMMKGYAGLIETIAHEGWHAVQAEYGMIKVDSNNQMYSDYDITIIELDAYNMGITMYNRYAEQNNISQKKFLTLKDVKKLLGL